MPIIEPLDKSLGHYEGLHLWHGDFSSCSQRVRITLAEKNLNWESHLISITKERARYTRTSKKSPSWASADIY
jgi:GST-like protein